MTTLTEDDLAKLYPTPKTYDELQAEREKIQEIRRPKLVALRVALQTSLGIIVALLAYHFIAYNLEHNIPKSGSTQDTGIVMVAVFGTFIAIGGTAAILHYLYSRTASLIHLTFAQPARPAVLIGAVLLVVAVVLSLTAQHDYNELIVSSILIVIHFIVTICIIAFTSKE